MRCARAAWLITLGLAAGCGDSEPQVALSPQADDGRTSRARSQQDEGLAGPGSVASSRRAGDRSGRAASGATPYLRRPSTQDAPEEVRPGAGGAQVTLGQDEAAALARQAARRGAGRSPSCAAAYDSLKTFIDGVARRTPGDQGPPPPREDFITSCEMLPDDMQRCLVPDYRDRHTEECEEVGKGSRR